MKRKILQSNERKRKMTHWIFLMLVAVAAVMVSFLYVLSNDK